jgi:hypothetical protein
MRYIIILALFFGLQSFAYETCQSLFEKTNLSQNTEAQVSKILLDLYGLRNTALKTQDEKAALISKIEFNKKLSELEKYIPLEVIREKLKALSIEQASIPETKETDQPPLLPEINRLLSPPELKSWRIDHNRLFNYSSDQDLGIYLDGDKHEAIVADVTSGKQIFTTTNFQDNVYRAGFTKKTNIIYTTNFAGDLQFYDISQGRQIANFVPQKILGFDATFSTNNEYMLTHARGDTYLYHLVNNQYELVSGFRKNLDRSSSAHSNQYFYRNGIGAVFTPDEKNIIVLEVAGKDTLNIVEYDLGLKSKRIIVEKVVAKERGLNLSISTDGKTLVLGSVEWRDTWVRKYDIQTGKKIFKYEEHEFNYVASEDHKYVYIISNHNRNNFQVFDMETGKLIHNVEDEYPTYGNDLFIKYPYQVIVSGMYLDKIIYNKIWEWK